MNERPEIYAEIRRWVEKAENDLRNGEYVLTLEEECPTDTVCFHAHQCAEKYLKALPQSAADMAGRNFPENP